MSTKIWRSREGLCATVINALCDQLLVTKRTRYRNCVAFSVFCDRIHLNCAAKAAVFLASNVDETISQSPPMGSFTPR